MEQHIQKELDIIKENVLKTVPVEAIYLFGSYAYGNPTKNSDLDIYVVIPDSIEKNPLIVNAEILNNLYKKVKTPFDLLVGKSSTFNERKNGPTLQKTIAKRGVLLHGK